MDEKLSHLGNNEFLNPFTFKCTICHFIRKVIKYGFVYGEVVFVNLPTLESAYAIPFSLLILCDTQWVWESNHSLIFCRWRIVMWMWYIITWHAESEIARKSPVLFTWWVVWLGQDYLDIIIGFLYKMVE